LNWIAKNKFGGVGLASLKADDQDGKCGEGLFPVHNYVGKHFRCSWSNDETDEDNNKPTVCTRLCIIRPENAPNEFSLSNMEPQWCSHIVISSAKILSLPGSLYLSDKMKQLVDDYKQWNVEGKPKLIISIGAHEIPDNWRVYLFTRYRRQILIDSIKKVLLDTEAEGVDISWTRGHLDSAKDTEIFILFVEELKKQIGQQFLIFVEVTPQSTFNERYDFVRMNRSVDFIIAQGHRFHSHKKAFTGHHSPLFMAEDLIDIRMNIEGFTSELVKRGVPKEKLIVGLSAEAMGMHLMVGERGETEIGAPSSPFDHVKRRNMPGEVSQSDVCLSLEKNSTISKFHPKIGVPYLIDGFEFIAYDDVHSIQLKTIWTSMNGYGGIALFGVEMDNVDGECPKREPYQLLKTIVDAQICEVCAKQKIRDHQNSSSPLASSANSCTKSSFQVLCGYRLAKEDGTEPLEAYMIPYQKCTEIVVEEAIWDADGELRYEESAQDSLRDLVQFHTQHQNNSKLVSAIRCNMTEQEFINFIGDNERFVEKILSHMNLFGYSGIEFRCKDVITAETNSAFSSMLENLQRNFKTAKSSNECKKTVGIRIPAHTNNLKSFYNISALNKLHSIVIDSFPSPSNYSELLNPLFGVGLGGEFVTLDSTIKNWIIEGVDPRKIVFSIPAYGTWQQLKNSSNHDLGEPVEDAIDLLTQELLYKKFKQLGITDRKFVYEAVGAYATTIDDEFLSYETPETVGYKVKYAIRENLGGVAIDSLNHEDFNNVSTTGPFPLLEAIDLNKCFV
uniref:GH18 domain-containing protein n=1 Tax=Acrobeloides nanus TaxID=290746 RepID=A0A914CE57_9BILA